MSQYMPSCAVNSDAVPSADGRATHAGQVGGAAGGLRPALEPLRPAGSPELARRAKG